MKTYRELAQNPPVLNVKKNANDIIIHLVSSMCDNKKLFRFKKINNEFRLRTGMFAYSNFGIPMSKTELEWMADDGEWDEVFRQINSGYQKIAEVKSR